MKIHGKTIAECRAILDDWAQPAGEWKNLGHALLDVLEDIENVRREAISTDKPDLHEVLREGVSRAEYRRRCKRLEKNQCPMCGSDEWFPGAACWHCGWESEPRPSGCGNGARGFP